MAIRTIEAYPSGSKSSKEVALLTGSGVTRGCIILSVNVNWDPYTPREDREVYQVKGVGSRVKVPPGKHKVYLEYYDVSKGIFYSKTGFVLFNAKAGKTYIAKGKEIDGVALFWIEDADTEAVGGGTKP